MHIKYMTQWLIYCKFSVNEIYYFLMNSQYVTTEKSVNYRKLNRNVS